MSDFSPSAVQSDTIQPQSTVLNGNAPYKINVVKLQKIVVYNMNLE